MVTARADLLWSVSVSVLAAFALIALGLEADAAGAGPSTAFLASSLSCAALPVALRRPIGATVMQGIAVAALGLGAEPGVHAQVPVVSIGVLVVHVGLVAAHHDWRVAVGVWWALNGVRVLVAAVDDRITKPDGTTTVAVLAVCSLVVLLAGIGYRKRVRIREELAAARRDVALEQERRSLAEERTRIARELHDVVAHAMSVIAVQSGVGAHVIDSQPEEARRALLAIESTSRSALDEMRRLLGVLREDDGARAGLTPAPGLDDLDGLVAEAASSGLTVDVAVEGRRPDVPQGLDLSAFRIVQEALTNVRRHAGATAARVVVRYTGDEVALEVTDDGRGGPVADGAGTARGGHGIIGMRERRRCSAARSTPVPVRRAGSASRRASPCPRRVDDDPGRRRRRPGTGAGRVPGAGRLGRRPRGHR
jgi:signal transduction histidine kinase